MTKSDMTVGKFIQMIRTEYLEPPLTQEEFAKQFCGGISRSFLANIEKGFRPPPDEVIEDIATSAGKSSSDRSFFAREMRRLVAKHQSEKFYKDIEQEIEQLATHELFYVPHELQALIDDAILKKGISLSEVAESIGVSFIECRQMIKGLSPIKRQDFIYLANKLGENVDSWLNFVNYVPTDISNSISLFFKKNPTASAKDLIKKITS